MQSLIDSYGLEARPCERTEENIWRNMEAAGNCGNLQLVSLVSISYYKFHATQMTPKSPADLELELRARGLDKVGLVAVKLELDPAKQLVEAGKAVVLQKRFAHIYESGKQGTRAPDDFDAKHLAEHVTHICCRPRRWAIDETMKHSSSMEEIRQSWRPLETTWS